MTCRVVLPVWRQFTAISSLIFVSVVVVVHSGWENPRTEFVDVPQKLSERAAYRANALAGLANFGDQ
jgi:hypothetical protein